MSAENSVNSENSGIVAPPRIPLGSGELTALPRPQVVGGACCPTSLSAFGRDFRPLPPPMKYTGLFGGKGRGYSSDYIYGLLPSNIHRALYKYYANPFMHIN